MFDEFLINGNEVYPKRSSDEGVRLKIRLPWYRSLPLSCVERVDIKIDGESISRDNTLLSLYGQKHTMDEVLKKHNTVWFVLDTADIIIRTDKPLEVGNHDVSVEMKLRVPYRDPEGDFIDFDFNQIVRCNKNLQFEGRDL
jgi:hypothetical protein